MIYLVLLNGFWSLSQQRVWIVICCFLFYCYVLLYFFIVNFIYLFYFILFYFCFYLLLLFNTLLIYLFGSNWEKIGHTHFVRGLVYQYLKNYSLAIVDFEVAQKTLPQRYGIYIFGWVGISIYLLSLISWSQGAFLLIHASEGLHFIFEIP
jgi:hypothetical protein